MVHIIFPQLLYDAGSSNEKIALSALGEIKDAIAPWELLDGDGSYIDLMAIAQNPVPETTIPDLIQLLKNDNAEIKAFILEILYDLSRYGYVDKTFIPNGKEESYMDWARRLCAKVTEGLELYQALLNDSSPVVRQGATDLVELLNIAV